MNRYEFESLISDYLDGSIPFNKQREFEQYMDENPNAEDLFKKIRNTISNMNELRQLKVSDNFNDKLFARVEKEQMVSTKGENTIFGFTPFYASLLSCLCVAFFIFASQLFNVSEVSDSHNRSYQHTSSLKSDSKINKDNNLQKNDNRIVDSNIDSVKNKQERKKPSNSNKIKFVNY